MVKSARLLLVAALLAVVGACAPTNPEPMAALPDAPPMMVPSIAPPPAPRAVHSAPKRLSSVKKHRHVKEHKVAGKKGKHTKVAKHSKKKPHHTKVAKASKRHAPASTRLVASRVKPTHVPLDAPPPPPPPTAPMTTVPGPLSPGLR